ncbi:Hypothetical_protein [Hexamita inflata]|uniref:Hypothetical_protein n=1 Tax=Hexamita inflata TaxID=28002 RepID=A0AA86RDR1_9EUKA|nr:Hypothetical protein HINF_LOCUS63365 [Hexamita inflata]
MLDCERMNGTTTFQKITMSYSDSTIHTGSIRIFLEPTFAKIAILPDSLFIQCLYRFDVMSNYFIILFQISIKHHFNIFHLQSEKECWYDNERNLPFLGACCVLRITNTIQILTDSFSCNLINKTKARLNHSICISSIMAILKSKVGRAFTRYHKLISIPYRIFQDCHFSSQSFAFHLQSDFHYIHYNMHNVCESLHTHPLGRKKCGVAALIARGADTRPNVHHSSHVPNTGVIVSCRALLRTCLFQ